MPETVLKNAQFVRGRAALDMENRIDELVILSGIADKVADDLSRDTI
jgi:hypothetical protein